MTAVDKLERKQVEERRGGKGGGGVDKGYLGNLCKVFSKTLR